MTVQEMQKEILRLKEEQGMCILAHTYQSHDVTEIADFTGDSFQLSMKAKNDPRKKVLMCGVRFKAETVKILSPEKEVYLSAENADILFFHRIFENYASVFDNHFYNLAYLPDFLYCSNRNRIAILTATPEST